MKQVSVLALVLLLALGTARDVAATAFSVQASQRSYGPGDTILITADLLNDYDQRVEIVVECRVSGDSGLAPDALVMRSVALEPNQWQTVILYQALVADDFPADRYTAAATLVESGVVRGEQEVSFVVRDTLQPLSFEVYLTGAGGQEAESRVFVMGDRIQIRWASPVSEVEVEAVVTLPNGEHEPVALPATLEAAQAGSYLLRVSASRPGYIRSTQELNFAVIDEEPEIAIQGAPRSPIAGDINGDGQVDFRDLAILGAAYDTRRGEPGYNVSADLNGDGAVDDADLNVLEAGYRQSAGY